MLRLDLGFGGDHLQRMGPQDKGYAKLESLEVPMPNGEALLIVRMYKIVGK